jgi:hypothetical protein
VKLIEIKTTDCSCKDLIRTAERCGFLVQQGKKHVKVKTAEGKFVTMIPRHSLIKRETAKKVLPRRCESLEVMWR